jgi:sensor domain CHASE-containing protein
VGLHKKTLIAACLGALALIVVVFSSTRFVLVHSFATIEADEARQSIERVNQALQMELQQLRAVTEDNGYWDQAYDYVRGQRENFIDENFKRSGLDTMRVHLLWIGDNTGKTLVSLGTHDAAPGALAQLDPDLVGRIQKYALALVPRDSADSQVRLMRVPGGVLAFSAVRVLQSNRQGASPGVLVFGHYVDDALITRLEETSQSPVKLILLDDHGVPMADVNNSVARWLANTPNDTFIQTNDA